MALLIAAIRALQCMRTNGSPLRLRPAFAFARAAPSSKLNRLQTQPWAGVANWSASATERRTWQVALEWKEEGSRTRWNEAVRLLEWGDRSSVLSSQQSAANANAKQNKHQIQSTDRATKNHNINTNHKPQTTHHQARSKKQKGRRRKAIRAGPRHAACRGFGVWCLVFGVGVWWDAALCLIADNKRVAAALKKRAYESACEQKNVCGHCSVRRLKSEV
jgi:hypothetical protein